jgi:Uma2 family endonuclease
MVETTTIIDAESATFAPARQLLPIEQRTDVTVDELERTSLEYPAELYNGKVVFYFPDFEHGLLQGRIGADLDHYLEKNFLGHAMIGTTYRLWPNRSDQARRPDISFIRNDRLPKDLWRFPIGAPDWAVEIISPEDKFMHIMAKVDAYLEQGTQIVWVVISDTREVLVCTAAGKHSVKDVLTAPELLPGFELQVSKIFEGLPLPDKSLAE